jgi:hypothetical protein
MKSLIVKSLSTIAVSAGINAPTYLAVALSQRTDHAH